MSAVERRHANGNELRMFMDEDLNRETRITVCGVGGGGCNAVEHMARSGVRGVNLLAANTDAQALRKSCVPLRMQIGVDVTKGLGAGADPEVGRRAALADVERIGEHFAGSDVVFITAGMGGGTGTGAAPVFAEAAREAGALVVAIVTRPFRFEGGRRMRHAAAGLGELLNSADTVITIPNENLLGAVGRESTLSEAFLLVDEVLSQAVSAVTDLITTPGLINVDFADVRAVMGGMGRGLMGAGLAAGEHRAVDAALQAISSPLHDEASMRGAPCLLLNVTGGPDLTLHEVNEAASTVTEYAHEDANVIFGAVIDEGMSGAMKVTVISTGHERAVVADLGRERRRREEVRRRASAVKSAFGA
jgi:cell division protein FtsZ